MRTQVYLDERQVRRLRRLAAVTGKTHSQFIREAVDRLEAPEERTAVLAGDLRRMGSRGLRSGCTHATA
ncbi:MAG: ribbon-helix-helix domain-containing protein [Rubricoccaceae bacterium]